MTDGSLKPAWSEAFEPEVLAPVRPLLPNVITPEWAWGGATGGGVDVPWWTAASRPGTRWSAP